MTEIGNALGYIRMVRSAGMNWVSGAISFVPDIDSIINFESHCGNGPIKTQAQVQEEEDKAASADAGEKQKAMRVKATTQMRQSQKRRS